MSEEKKRKPGKNPLGRPPVLEAGLMKEIHFANIIAYEIKKRGMAQARMAQQMGIVRATLNERLQVPLSRWYYWEILIACEVLEISWLLILLREEDLQKKLAKFRKIEALEDNEYSVQ